ncbi:hypothetical protein T02_13154 [Trichinella nativa]|uniref:Uncharacterized protein n=1 Tax=Trichinella nativa TaxID=6335 RepID=A0A0V1KLR7_9BILA|nr:hypothetical protein T02_13154 [Trichinella nativa]
MAGVTPVLSLTLLLYDSMTKESTSSHCCRFSSHILDIMSRSMRLNLSACPFPCGWYEEGRVILMSKRRYNSRITRASNERPWSLCKQSSAPMYAMYFSISTLATVSASMLVGGNATVHLVKISVSKRGLFQWPKHVHSHSLQRITCSHWLHQCAAVFLRPFSRRTLRARAAP